jgi:PAS domain S-box-containing protein
MRLEEMTSEQMIEYARRLRAESEARATDAFREEAARERAQLALLKSEDKYRRLFEKSPVGIISVDAEGRIEEVNPTLLRILGSPSAEATKAINVFDFPPLVEAGIAKLFRSGIQTGIRLTGEFPYTGKWGVASHLRLTVSPLKDEHGRVTGCEGVVEDVSDRKRLEERLLHSRKMEATDPPTEGATGAAGDQLRTILVVDDQPLVRDIARRILEKAGYLVWEAESGADAIRVFREEYRRVALVIFETAVLGMDGARFLKELAGIDPDVKTLVSGGFSRDFGDAGFPASVVKGTISKPFNMATLIRAVRDAIAAG